MDINMNIKLSVEALREFSVAKIFQESAGHKYSMCFSSDGQHLVVCDHQNLTVFDCNCLKQQSLIHMRKYRPELVCFTPQNNKLLHNSTNRDYNIRCLDLSSHQHVGLFSGHTGRLRALCVQPGRQVHFMSAGLDDRVLMWDLRTSSYTHHLSHLRQPLVDFDPTGVLFATSSSTECIEVHDVRKLGAKPCHKFGYRLNDEANWTQLQFAPNGKSLLVSTDYSWCFSVDAFSGRFRRAYAHYANEARLPLQVCHTPDSQFVLAGADEGNVHVWHAASGETAAVLHTNSNSTRPVRCLQFNPKLNMFASGDVLTHFWLPKPNHKKNVEQQSVKPLASQIIPIIDLTTDDNYSKLDDLKQEQLNNIIAWRSRQPARSSWPMPIRLPRFQPAVAGRGRRLPLPAWQVDEDDSLEEGEIR